MENKETETSARENIMLLLDQKNHGSLMQATKDDKLSILSGVEVSVPYIDFDDWCSRINKGKQVKIIYETETILTYNIKDRYFDFRYLKRTKL